MTTEWTAAHAAAADPAPMSIIGGSWTHIPPTPEEVDPLSILLTLAGVLRWNGRLGPTCTVAAHTWALLRWAELARNGGRGPLGRGVKALSDADYADLRRALLVHDWHEAWTDDISGPVKKAVKALAVEESPLERLQRNIDNAIGTRLGFFPSSTLFGLAHEMDSAICSAEVVAWEMRPDLLLRVLAKHGDPDPFAVVASLEARKLAEASWDAPTERVERSHLPLLVERLLDELDALFPNHGSGG